MAERWAAGVLAALLAGLADGSVARCPHYPGGGALRAWHLRARLVACRSCLAELPGPVPGSGSCDRCGQAAGAVAGVFRADGQALAYLLCGRCAADV